MCVRLKSNNNHIYTCEAIKISWKDFLLALTRVALWQQQRTAFTRHLSAKKEYINFKECILIVLLTAEIFEEFFHSLNNYFVMIMTQCCLRLSGGLFNKVWWLHVKKIDATKRTKFVAKYCQINFVNFLVSLNLINCLSPHERHYLFNFHIPFISIFLIFLSLISLSLRYHKIFHNSFFPFSLSSHTQLSVYKS